MPAFKDLSTGTLTVQWREYQKQLNQARESGDANKIKRLQTQQQNVEFWLRLKHIKQTTIETWRTNPDFN